MMDSVIDPVLSADADLLLSHAHHWLIAKQDGENSEGTCKSCGATRDFANAYFRTYRSPMYLRHSRPPRPSPGP